MTQRSTALSKMKWRAARGLTFRAPESKAPSGLNPGTRLAVSPGRNFGAWDGSEDGREKRG